MGPAGDVVDVRGARDSVFHALLEQVLHHDVVFDDVLRKFVDVEALIGSLVHQ